MSPVAIEITLLLADATPRGIERLSDEVEAAVMGIGEVVGYDYIHEPPEVTLILGGDDADRLLSIALPLARALGPLPGSYYTVGDADRHDETESAPRVSL